MACLVMPIGNQAGAARCMIQQSISRDVEHFHSENCVRDAPGTGKGGELIDLATGSDVWKEELVGEGGDEGVAADSKGGCHAVFVGLET